MKKQHTPLVAILFLGFLLRIIGIAWDQGGHLHPDERALIMVATNIDFLKDANPHFFNYGSLPLYLLKVAADILSLVLRVPYATYEGMLFIGRSLVIAADLCTLLLVYAICRQLGGDKRTARLSSLAYAVAFFPVQNTHFFIVDVFLTLFTTLIAYFALAYHRHQSFKNVVFLAIAAAAALATKFTAVLFFPIVVIFFFLPTAKEYNWRRNLYHAALFGLCSLVVAFAFMPFAFIDYTKFITDVFLQLKLNSDPYTFPYTLQYVGTAPYYYYLKNIVLWGWGPPLTMASLIGATVIIGAMRKAYLRSFTPTQKKKAIVNYKSLLGNIFTTNAYFFLLFLLYGIYFVLIGRSAVKFMRYMLPLYPLFAILAGYGLAKVRHKWISYSLLFLAGVWTLSFVSIYTSTHTRIAATDWLLENVPHGATIAVEHWDDRLPMTGIENYNIAELTLYDQPDDDAKWIKIQDQLKNTDYIVVASNRLYVPITRLSDCAIYKTCFPLASQYYKKLFAEELPFTKVAEFAIYPTLPYLNAYINDQGADESFTVYDHPKILIFKKK